MKLRPAENHHRILIDGAINRLKEARDAAAEAGAVNLARKIRSALASADGARRHLDRRLRAPVPVSDGHPPTS